MSMTRSIPKSNSARFSSPAGESTFEPGSGKFQVDRYSRLMILASLLAILNILVFADYYAGAVIPPWDFLGSYNTEAYYWWEAGGFFRPVSWIPSTWAGYPGSLNLQNSAWYLPVGLVAFFTPYTLHAAAILAALHTSAGFVAMYALLRSREIGFSAATLGATVWFFAPGFFANASHVDIARGYALLPLLLLVTSSRWNWRRVWSIPITAIVIWQVLTGVYPGMVIAFVYVGVWWVIVSQVTDRPRLSEFFGPLFTAVVIGGLLAAPRFWTFLALGNSGASDLPDASFFSFGMLSTFFYDYGSPALPNDVTMRSFFLPAFALLLIPFAVWKSKTAICALAIFVPSAMLVFPFWPWFDLAQQLPGLGASRFTMSDFKPLLLISVLLLAATAADRFLASSVAPREISWTLTTRSFFLRTSGSFVLFGISSLAFGSLVPKTSSWVMPLIVAAVSLASVIAFIATPRLSGNALGKAALATALVIVSGTVGTLSTSQTWRTERVAAETVTLTASVDALIAQSDSANSELMRRPARVALPNGFTASDLYSNQFNRAYYSGEEAVGGYVNFKGVETQALLADTLVDTEIGAEFARFLAAPGVLMVLSEEDSIRTQLMNCADLAEGSAGCGTVAADSTTYSPGNFSYKVSSPEPVKAITNEAYYPGWVAFACMDGDASGCSTVTASQSEFGTVQLDLPRGDYEVHLRYEEPGNDLRWLPFWLGIGGIVAVSVLRLLLSSRTGRQEKV